MHIPQLKILPVAISIVILEQDLSVTIYMHYPPFEIDEHKGSIGQIGMVAMDRIRQPVIRAIYEHLDFLSFRINFDNPRIE